MVVVVVVVNGDRWMRLTGYIVAASLSLLSLLLRLLLIVWPSHSSSGGC